MRLAVAVNDALAISASSTTLAIARAAHARGHDLVVFGVADISLDDGASPYARAFVFPADGPTPPVHPIGLKRSRVAFEEFDALAIRTSPGRDPQRLHAHDALLRWAEQVADAPTFVFNDPTALRRAGTKDFLARLPLGTRPEMLVSKDVDEVLRFIQEREHGGVIKPLLGTRGTDVFRLVPERMGNARMIAQSVARHDFVLVQHYLSEAPNGDTRVVMVGGEVLEVDGLHAAVRRVPQPGEFRSNIHLGATAHPATLSAAQLDTLEAVGAVVREHDLFLVGVDLIGDQVIELNVHATGGLTDASRFTGKDFLGALVARIEERAG